jgi:NADPH:quinone reductase-like Zn-dependent oxidoreductase
LRAVYFENHGDPSVLRLGQRPDAPPPRRGEVRIRVRRAALNHLDLFVLEGLPNVPIPLPQIPGADAAGEVESCGEEVSDFSPGDRVLVQPGLYCTTCEFCRAGEQSQCVRYALLGEHVTGTFAELVTLPARNFFRIPDGVSLEQAASFPLVYQTAWRMLIGRARLAAGETVLIHGIGGGVASAALDIARLAGARVFVTSSDERKLAAARQAGAALAWNYRRQDIAREVAAATGKRGCDVVVDTVGAATWLVSLRAAARGGRVVTCGATSGPNPQEEIRMIFWKHLSILGSTMANDREFREVMSEMFRGRLRAKIDATFPADRVQEAYRRLAAGAHDGKILLRF